MSFLGLWLNRLCFRVVVFRLWVAGWRILATVNLAHVSCLVATSVRVVTRVAGLLQVEIVVVLELNTICFRVATTLLITWVDPWFAIVSRRLGIILVVSHDVTVTMNNLNVSVAINAIADVSVTGANTCCSEATAVTEVAVTEIPERWYLTLVLTVQTGVDFPRQVRGIGTATVQHCNRY